MEANAAWYQMESIRRRRWLEAVGQRKTPGDLVQRLRDRAYGCKIPDPLVEEAADEIERLRVTDAEREAVDRQAKWLFAQAKNKPDIHSADLLLQEAATLRGLLERLR